MKYYIDHEDHEVMVLPCEEGYAIYQHRADSADAWILAPRFRFNRWPTEEDAWAHLDLVALAHDWL